MFIAVCWASAFFDFEELEYRENLKNYQAGHVGFFYTVCVKLL
jgi:hypothetical protein